MAAGEREGGRDRSSSGESQERVIEVNRCAKVVKGGRRFSFSALVVVGDRDGQVGYALGKANEVADAIRKAGDIARKNMFRVTMKDRTIPYEVVSKSGGAKVLLKPASPGTGVIAGGGMRAVIELSGIRDVLAKCMGSSNSLNVVRATIDALRGLRSREEILQARRGAAA